MSYTGVEKNWYSLQQPVCDLSCEDAVDTDVQANGTIVALVVFDERVYKSRIRRDKAVERLYRAQSVY